MVFNKDSFFGALGKTNKLLRSRFAATPNTKKLTSHEKFCDIDPSLELVTCSLDGMMWLYRNGNNFQVFLHQWDAETGTLTQNVAQHIINSIRQNYDPAWGTDEPIIRGVDWVLTKDYIIQADQETGELYYSRLIAKDIKDLYIGERSPRLTHCPTPEILKYYSHAREAYWWAFGLNYETWTIYDSYGNLAQASWADYYYQRNIGANGHWVSGGFDPYTGSLMYDDLVPNGMAYFHFNEGLSLYGGFYRHPMSACYSLLPSIGDWIMIEDFMIRRPKTPLTGNKEAMDYDSVLVDARALTPLEFNYYPNADLVFSQSFCTYGTGFANNRRGTQVAASDNMLFAKGLMQIGRAYLLPAGLDGEGNPQEFYLFIQNTWNCRSPYDHFNEDSRAERVNADWLDLSLAVLRDPETNASGVVAFHERQTQNLLTGSVCRKSTGDLLLPVQIAGWTLPDGAECQFDALNQSGLLLSSQGATFLTWNGGDDVASLRDYKCSTLDKWLAPAGRIDSVSIDGVLAVDDSGVLATDIKNHFFRTRFFGSDYNPILPIAWNTLEAPTGEVDEHDEPIIKPFRLSLAEKNKTVYMQRLSGGDFPPQAQIPWVTKLFRQICTNCNKYI